MPDFTQASQEFSLTEHSIDDLLQPVDALRGWTVEDTVF